MSFTWQDNTCPAYLTCSPNHAGLLGSDSAAAAIVGYCRFHGGCFTGGSPEGADGSSIIEESGGDVIVVTVAFRLGIFGHLASNILKSRSMKVCY